ncbi:MAG TPA: motility protein A [Spirochaetota bacterium]|nr:motility protein A [Spirochaetota bacterium]HRZ27708.1 motility protein A [Spirochaetota bacterium]HSA15416.1 motility protein A [Spirochaetota bacterium]
MDIAIVIGIASGLVFILMAIIVAGGSLLMFWDPPSVMVTFGGCISALLVAFPLNEVLKFPTYFKAALFPQRFDLGELILTMVSFSEKARREGLLALEDDLDQLDDQFMKKGLQLVVDGTDPELVKNIMENEIDQMAARHDTHKAIFDDAAGFAPGFGMIGTLMGLVLMLVNLNDRSSVGPYLAVAIITTFYGAVAAYLVFTPLGRKLDQLTGNEVLQRSLVLMGVLSIQSGDNPRIVKDKLVSFLQPGERDAITQEIGE